MSLKEKNLNLIKQKRRLIHKDLFAKPYFCFSSDISNTEIIVVPRCLENSYVKTHDDLVNVIYRFLSNSLKYNRIAVESDDLIPTVVISYFNTELDHQKYIKSRTNELYTLHDTFTKDGKVVEKVVIIDKKDKKKLVVRKITTHHNVWYFKKKLTIIAENDPNTIKVSGARYYKVHRTR